MAFTVKQWMYGGAALLAAVSSFIVLAGVPSVWFPMPLPLVIVAFVTMILFPFVTPAVYVAVVKLFARSAHFPMLVLLLVIGVGALNYYYFHVAWEYGVRYQGLGHTKIVALENAAGFTLAAILAIWAHLKKSCAGAFGANLLLFVLLSWCAFPYLGELP